MLRSDLMLEAWRRGCAPESSDLLPVHFLFLQWQVPTTTDRTQTWMYSSSTSGFSLETRVTNGWFGVTEDPVWGSVASEAADQSVDSTDWVLCQYGSSMCHSTLESFTPRWRRSVSSLWSKSYFLSNTPTTIHWKSDCSLIFSALAFRLSLIHIWRCRRRG